MNITRIACFFGALPMSTISESTKALFSRISGQILKRRTGEPCHAGRCRWMNSIPVRIQAIGKTGNTIAVNIIDMDMEGVTLAFESDAFFDPTPDDIIMLNFSCLRSPDSLVVHTRVKSCAALEGKKYCRFIFSEPDSIEHLKGLFQPHLHRPLTFRKTRYNATRSIHAELEWDGGFAHGHIIAVSSTRILLEITPEIAGAVGNTNRVILTFRLPDCPTPLKIVGRIHQPWFWKKKPDVPLVFEWDWRQTKDFERQEALIAVYLMNQHTNHPT